jgi:hypothetical protein
VSVVIDWFVIAIYSILRRGNRYYLTPTALHAQRCYSRLGLRDCTSVTTVSVPLRAYCMGAEVDMLQVGGRVQSSPLL